MSDFNADFLRRIYPTAHVRDGIILLTRQDGSEEAVTVERARILAEQLTACCCRVAGCYEGDIDYGALPEIDHDAVTVPKVRIVE